jgi:transcriptional antiterminator NusG
MIETNEAYKNWYVLQVYNTCELSVKDKIEIKMKETILGDLIINVIAPYEDVVSISEKGNRTNLKKAIYPGYVYIQIREKNEGEQFQHHWSRIWQQLRDIPKLSKFIGNKNEPFLMSHKEIDKVLNADKLRFENKETKYRVKFEKGSTVIIKEGSFANFKGTIVSHDPERKKVILDVSIFGRPTQMEIGEKELEVTHDE